MDWFKIGTLISTVIDKIFPDADTAAKAKQELLKIDLENTYKLLYGQLEINKEEAKHPSLFVSGWRPFVGWVCGLSLLYHSILLPIIVLCTGAPLPAFDFQLLSTVLLGLLGLGTMRSYEKAKGVSKNNLKE